MNFGDILTEPAKTSKKIKRSGWYSLEFGPTSDAGIIIDPQQDSAYQLEFYFRNNRAEFGIELLQGSNSGDTTVVNSRIGLYGDNLGTFDYGGSSGQFFYIPNEWNHARVMLDMPSGKGTLIINEEEITQWNWNVQQDGNQNTNPFMGIRFGNSGSSGSGLIDDINLSYTKTTGIRDIVLDDLSIVYNPLHHEIQIGGNPGIISGLELFDLRGRKIITFTGYDKQRFQLDEEIPNGVFVMQISFRDGSSMSRKISIVR